MYTSLAWVALVGLVPAQTDGDGPQWLNDYGQAQKQGQQQKKPLAVFVGAGKEGYRKVCRDGQLSEAVQKQLARDYVCVFLDTTTAEGKRLRAALKVTEETGLVLSDRTGAYMAFRYGGTLSDAELTRSLKRFADPNYITRSTVTSPHEQVSFYPPDPGNGATNGYSSPRTISYTPAPASYATAPAFGGYGGYGGFGGGRGC